MVTRTQQEFLLGALIGGAVGAAAALIITPLSGAALRKQMANGINSLNGNEVPKKKAPPKRKATKRTVGAKATKGTKGTKATKATKGTAGT